MPKWLKNKLVMELYRLDDKRLTMREKWTSKRLREIYLLTYQTDLLNETLTGQKVENYVVERAINAF